MGLFPGSATEHHSVISCGSGFDSPFGACFGVAVIFLSSSIPSLEAQIIYDAKKPVVRKLLSRDCNPKPLSPWSVRVKIGKVKVVKQANVKAIDTREISRKVSQVLKAKQ